MDYQTFLSLCRDKPLIRSADFLSEGPSFSVQLGRWVKDGRLIQLKRGYYVLSDLYRKDDINRFYLANNLVWPSYVSLEKALEYWGLVPEAVTRYTCATTKRPQEIDTKVGVFTYRHIQASLFWGYQSIKQSNLVFFVATPEKAILDLFYFHPEQITEDYISGLRLQNTEMLNQDKLYQMAEKFNKPKIRKACQKVTDFIRFQEEEFQAL